MKNKRHLMLQWIKDHSLILKLIFWGSVLVFVANQVANIAHDMSWQDIWQTKESQNHFTLALMIIVGLIGVVPIGRTLFCLHERKQLCICYFAIVYPYR